MSDGPLADVMRGHFGGVGNADTDHVEVPSGHAPRIIEQDGVRRSVMLHEEGNPDGWIKCEHALSRSAWE